MSAVERLQSAIEKLEAMRERDVEGGWIINADAELIDADGNVVAVCTSELDAETVVALHRTIDAQLGILRRAVDGWAGVEAQDALALADAILGDQS